MPSRSESTLAQRAPLRKSTIFIATSQGGWSWGSCKVGQGRANKASAQGWAKQGMWGHVLTQPGTDLTSPCALGDVASAAGAGRLLEP